MLSLIALAAVLAWPGGEVAYRFDASVRPDERAAFKEALSLWHHPGLEFNETSGWLTELGWTLGWDRSVLVREDHSLRSFGHTTLGAGAHRELVFNPAMTTPDWLVADLAHEWGHVLGLTHEHQRRDRDLNIMFPPGFLEGLSLDRKPDYTLDESDPPTDADRPYDFDSLMHYSSNIDGNRMVTKDGRLLVGSRRPSPGDWSRLAALYRWKTPKEAP